MVRGLGKLKTRVDLQRNMKRAGCVGGGIGRSVMLRGRNTRCCCPKPVWCKDEETGKTRLVAASECDTAVAPVLTFEFESKGANPALADKGNNDIIALSIISDVLLTGPPVVEMFDVNGDTFYSNALVAAGTAGLGAIQLKAGKDREYVATAQVNTVFTAIGHPVVGALTFRVTGATAKVGGKTAEAKTGGGVATN
mgnify:CR=1 FL=1